jgi:hypothetical protein
MKLKSILAALALGVAGGSASAAVLTFDNLTAMQYGGGEPLLPAMSYNGLSLTYVESGFQVTLHTPNASSSGNARIGNGTFEPHTYNWHDGYDETENGWDSFVTLTRVGGGLFNLSGFDYLTDWSKVTADGSLVGEIEGEGHWSTALNGISELRLSYGFINRVDNIHVEAANAVPLPGTLSLLLGGLAVGALARRRQR